jgi:hypothetical protein
MAAVSHRPFWERGHRVIGGYLEEAGIPEFSKTAPGTGEGPLREFNGITHSRFIRLPRKEVLVWTPARLRGLLLPLWSLKKSGGKSGNNPIKANKLPPFQDYPDELGESTIMVIPK